MIFVIYTYRNPNLTEEGRKTVKQTETSFAKLKKPVFASLNSPVF